MPRWMTTKSTRQPGTSVVRRWIRRGFLTWAVVSTLWIANSFRTQGVEPATLTSSAAVTVTDDAATLRFLPVQPGPTTGLVFICGGGVSARAYAPLLRPLADAGHPVIIVKLPYRLAPLDSHKQAAIGRVYSAMAAHPEVPRWVIAGHSLGGALACRAASSTPLDFAAMVLIGTTHPREDDLSALALPVTKIGASNDGVATRTQSLANKKLLPASTRWVEIEGGNHSQFGHYGRQLFDGKPSITREAQQAAARSVLLEVLSTAAK